MALYSDILLTVDYDRTLTAPDSTIPQRNLQAIQYFMDNGGSFTVNTGRSVPMSELVTRHVSVNAPLLLYNGGCFYDVQTKTPSHFREISLDQGTLMRKLRALVPEDMALELQGLQKHYAFSRMPEWEALYDYIGCPWDYCEMDSDIGPFLKCSICGPIRGTTVESLFSSREEDIARYDALEEAVNRTFPGQLTVVRAAKTILDIQAAGATKGTAARELCRELGKTTLVCIGDQNNDIPMLDAADYAFVPGDAALLGKYPAVCPCAEGSVADVIYKKIPEILGITLDNGVELC